MFNLQNFVVYLIIAIVILLLVKFFYCDEYFTEVSAISNIDKFVGLDKELNLSVSLNGKEYYVLPVNKSFCGIAESNPKDCTGTVLILKELKQYEDEIKIDKDKSANEVKLCNMAAKLDCETQMKAKMVTGEVTAEMETQVNDEMKNQCKDTYETCEKPYVRPGIFMIKKVNHFDTTSTKNLYNVLSSIKSNGTSNTMALSTAGPASTLELVCLEGAFPNSEPFSSVELEEALTQTENQTNPSFRIKFLLPQRFSNGMEVTKDGKVVYKSFYVGLCAGDKELKCSANGVDHFRLCLYNSVENPYVLKFTPKLISN